MGMCKTEGIAGPLDERLVAHQCLRSRRRCAIIIHYVSTRVLLTDYKLYSKAITSNMLGILHLTFSRPFIDDPICSRNLANCFSVMSVTPSFHFSGGCASSVSHESSVRPSCRMVNSTP